MTEVATWELVLFVFLAFGGGIVTGILWGLNIFKWILEREEERWV